MSLNTICNFTGLLLMTVGGIGAALVAPSPTYNADGSISLAGESSKEDRIKTHRRQKCFKPFLVVVGLGSFMQAIALLFLN